MLLRYRERSHSTLLRYRYSRSCCYCYYYWKSVRGACGVREPPCVGRTLLDLRQPRVGRTSALFCVPSCSSSSFFSKTHYFVSYLVSTTIWKKQTNLKLLLTLLHLLKCKPFFLLPRVTWKTWNKNGGECT